MYIETVTDDLILCSATAFQASGGKGLGATVSEKRVLVCAAVSTRVHMHVAGRLHFPSAAAHCHFPHATSTFLEVHGYLYVIG